VERIKEGEANHVFCRNPPKKQFLSALLVFFQHQGGAKMCLGLFVMCLSVVPKTFAKPPKLVGLVAKSLGGFIIFLVPTLKWIVPGRKPLICYPAGTQATQPTTPIPQTLPLLHSSARARLQAS